MKQGALIFDERTDRYDIRFDLADYYGGLHCGQCFENCTEELAKRGRERSSLLDGLKRPAQPGPDRGTPPKHSGPEL